MHSNKVARFIPHLWVEESRASGSATEGGFAWESEEEFIYDWGLGPSLDLFTHTEVFFEGSWDFSKKKLERVIYLFFRGYCPLSPFAEE